MQASAAVDAEEQPASGASRDATAAAVSRWRRGRFIVKV
jgi:hypothetical protein